MIGIYKQHKKLFLVFIVLTFILYGNTLKNKYALDDDYVTVTNFPVKGKNYVPNNELAANGFSSIAKIWKVRYAHDGESAFEYRPITSMSFAIEYGIFGQNPFISHLISILLYALTCCVLFCVLLKLFEAFDNREMLAALVTFIFLIHPAHTEVVNNIKSRDELFAFLFPLIAFWYSLKAYDKITFKNISLIILFFVIGCLSKRTALIFIGIVPLALVFFRKVNYKIMLSGVGIVLVAILANAMIKAGIIEEAGIRKFYHFENPMYTDHFTFFQKLIAGIKTLGFYTKFSFIPYPFRNYYGTGVVDISPGFDLNLLIGLLFPATIIWLYFKTKNKLFLFGLLLFLGGVFPFSNIYKPMAGVVGERLIYNASLGFSVILAGLVLPVFKNAPITSFRDLFKKPVLWFMPVVVVFSILIWTRNTHWKDKLTLFEHDIVYLEKSAKANSMLGNEYFELIRDENFKYPAAVLVQKALANYITAIKNDSSFYSAYNNAGVLYFSYLQDFTSAETYFKLALKTRPVYPQAYENIGNLYRHLGRKEEALGAYINSIKQNPKQYNAYISAIKLCYDSKQYQKAIAFSKVASIYFPNDYSLIGQEADALFMQGNMKQALHKYEDTYKLSANANLATYLAVKYLELGDTAKSNFYKNKQQ